MEASSSTDPIGPTRPVDPVERSEFAEQSERVVPPEGIEWVEVVDEQEAVAVDADRWARLVAASARDLGVPEPWVLTVRFVDGPTMAELNEHHMGQPGPTDVLSFPVDGPDLAAASTGPTPGSTRPTSVSVGSVPQADGPPVVLGDLVICPEVALANAPGHAGRGEDEIALLVVHGVLHLWGMDHAEPHERQIMQAAERDLLAAHHGPLAGDPWATDPVTSVTSASEVVP